MLINGFTVAAQILNFLILVVLLRWLLYKPIIKVMQQRQALIAERWRAAEQLQLEAARAAATYRQQQEALQQQQAELLAAAQAAADQERQRLLAEVRATIAAQQAAWQAELQQEQAAFLRSLRQQVTHQIVAIARRALTDLANATLEDQIVQVFCDRLRHLDLAQQTAIAPQALAETAQPLRIHSSFALSPARQQQVIDALSSHLPLQSQRNGVDATSAALPNVEFVTDPQLLCGIALKLAGQEIVWSLDTYLQTLEQRLADVLTQEEMTHHAPTPPAVTHTLH